MGILLGTWLLYVIYPASGIEPGQGLPEAGIQPGWAQEHLAGVGADWHKNANAGHAIDRVPLHLFPRSVASGFAIRCSTARQTEVRLWGGQLVAMPTAIPYEPFTNKFGNALGSTVGSLRLPS